LVRQVQDIDIAERAVDLRFEVVQRLEKWRSRPRQFFDEPYLNHNNASDCGEDQFDLYWQGQRYTADWHLKSGGNMRDPVRCLWEPNTQQIVVADMPAHRRSSAT
jgi:hypothetical protein